MSSVQFNVDLSNCDREPIHQLGAIQPFGALVAINADWFVARRSANLEEILGTSGVIELGSRLSEVVTPDSLARLRAAVAALGQDDHVERLFGLDLVGNGRRFDCAVHNSDSYAVFEMEPHVAEDIDRQLSLLRPVTSRLDRHQSVEQLCDEGARQLRHSLRFDRVMVYRFHEDLSGEVVAEARRDDLESFLGLRYPRSDIPSQARALYLRNRFRIISDVNAAPVPIEPGMSLEGDPLDLSMSTLRAVSPIHLEYLRNMGVEASLSISIVIDGKLWGLFACHNYAPKVLPYSQRTTAELFSEVFSLALERALARSTARQRESARKVHDRLMRDIAAGASLADSLPQLDPVIQTVLPHDGASVFIDDVYESRGAAPNEEEFRAMLPNLNGAATSRIFATERLADRIAPAARFADRATGALVIPVSRVPRDYFVLWRRELPQVVTWAGNPEKPAELGPNGARLTPRKSFEAWQESVRGRSAPWSEAELQIAEGLRITLLEIILRLTDEAVQERSRAQQTQELLIAELNHRVRNILNLIRGLINQTRHDAADVEGFARIVGGRINSLAAAHDNITRQNWSAAPVRDLIDTEAHAYFVGKTDRLDIEGPDANVSPEAYTVLALVIHELATNSAKYGSLSDRSGRLRVMIERREDDSLGLIWSESGGPPVKPPQRRGFGTTIIERSIPFELKGTAKVDYRLRGVRAEFNIPARYVRWESRQKKELAKAMGQLNATPNRLPESVLLVEDSMIIALDSEDTLRDLGVDKVRIESNVSGALDALKSATPELVLLDYNLGDESSERISEELVRLGIPFWLATGYGEMNDRVAEIGARGLLTKPYGRDELAAVLVDFGESGDAEARPS